MKFDILKIILICLIITVFGCAGSSLRMQRDLELQRQAICILIQERIISNWKHGVDPEVMPLDLMMELCDERKRTPKADPAKSLPVGSPVI